MSLAVPRQSIIDNVAQADQLPATGMTPKGMPGFDTINPNSPWTPAEGDMEQAKQLMSEVASPKKNITLYINDSPGHREIAVAIQAAWKELGITSTIKQQEFQQYLEFLGPPPNQDVDVYRLGWIGDFVDAINFLELWTCDSGNNNTNFCNKDYDAKIAQAKTTLDNEARYKVYGEAEQILFGENGDMPIIPIYFYTFPQLERTNIKDTFKTNLLNQTDLTKVVVTE
jgi:oligopeptide transport system substrate-binding protein